MTRIDLSEFARTESKVGTKPVGRRHEQGEPVV